MKTAMPRGLIFLSIAAGSADAVGYLGLGHVFTCNMTGNLVLLGIHIGEGNLADTGRSLFVLLLFLGGTGLGAWLDKGVVEENWVRLAARLLFTERVALGVLAPGWILGARGGNWDYALLALLSFAMGVQSALMQRLKVPGVGSTAITATLTALAAGIADMLAGPFTTAARRRTLLDLGVAVFYCLGAMAAGFLLMRMPLAAGCLPALAVLFASPDVKQC